MISYAGREIPHVGHFFINRCSTHASSASGDTKIVLPRLFVGKSGVSPTDESQPHIGPRGLRIPRRHANHEKHFSFTLGIE